MARRLAFAPPEVGGEGLHLAAGAKVVVGAVDEDRRLHFMVGLGGQLPAFDPADAEGVWLNWTFAREWSVKVGDEIELEHNGMKFTRRVKGLIMTPEYEYTKAEKDADRGYGE